MDECYSSIIAVYEAAGYTGEQAITGTKSIDNWFGDDKNKGATWKDFERSRKLLPTSRDSRTSQLRYDPKFIETCKSIATTPKYQFAMNKK